MRTEMYERMCVRIRLINKPCVYFWFGLWNIASGCSLEQLSMVCDQHFLQLTILICNSLLLYELTLKLLIVFVLVLELLSAL